MAIYDNAYSRFIAWLKIILPLVALGLLSTLFLFSSSIDPSQTIPYADVDIDELVREQRITSPNYTGMTDDGTAVSFFAESARPDPDNPNLLTAVALKAKIEAPSGLQVDISSEGGSINSTQRQSVLSGNVEVETSSGYEIFTERLTAALDGSLLETDRDVHAQGPLGMIEAGKMVLELEDADSDTYLLVFKGGVKLVYTP